MEIETRQDLRDLLRLMGAELQKQRDDAARQSIILAQSFKQQLEEAKEEADRAFRFRQNTKEQLDAVKLERDRLALALDGENLRTDSMRRELVRMQSEMHDRQVAIRAAAELAAENFEQWARDDKTSVHGKVVNQNLSQRLAEMLTPF